MSTKILLENFKEEDIFGKIILKYVYKEKFGAKSFNKFFW
jgi:hypothetical protein